MHYYDQKYKLQGSCKRNRLIDHIVIYGLLTKLIPKRVNYDIYLRKTENRSKYGKKKVV